MSMPFAILGFAIAIVFYLLIPGAGAFFVRGQWRLFRRRIREASGLPFLDYSDLRKDRAGQSFRFFGNLEAIQGKNRIWLTSGNLSIAVDLERVPIYILSHYSSLEIGEDILPDEQPQRIPWKQISSLPAGTSVFVAGALFFESGQAVLHSLPRSPLLAVLYDGAADTLLRRAIWGGRQRNEYWNPFTLISLLTGGFALLFLAYQLFSNPVMRWPARIALTLSVSPLLPLLPPGVFFLFLYRRFWREARISRGVRDLQRLPLRYFPSRQPETRSVTPDGEEYIMASGERGALLARVDNPEGLIERKSPTDEGEPYHLFGVHHPETGRITRPSDPMAELVLIRGNPAVNARICQKRARLYELASVFFFSLDLLPNLFLVLYLTLFVIP